MAAKKLNRKALRKDGFVDKTAESVEFLQEHYIKIVIGVLAVVVVYAGLTMYRNSTEAARRESVNLLFEGQSLIAQGNFPGASQRLEECIERFGGSESGKLARLDLGHALLVMGNNEGALATFEDGIAAAGSDQNLAGRLLGMKAVALSNLGRHAEAAIVLREHFAGLSWNARKLEVGMRLADVLQALDDLKGAVMVLEELEAAIAQDELADPSGSVEKRLSVLHALAG